MNSITHYPKSTHSSDMNTATPANFLCPAPDAKSVYLVGDFNDWDPTAHPMRQQADGSWLLQVSLLHGRHQYQFLVDGKPMLDPGATGIGHSQWNGQVSLIAVS